jgi:Flp pilus assembly pilin Flp
LQARPRGADSGATRAEYALLVALIVAAAILAITLLGTQASNNFAGR